MKNTRLSGKDLACIILDWDWKPPYPLRSAVMAFVLAVGVAGTAAAAGGAGTAASGFTPVPSRQLADNANCTYRCQSSYSSCTSRCKTSACRSRCSGRYRSCLTNCTTR